MSINLIDIKATEAETAEAAHADWTLFTEGGVKEIVQTVARSFGRDYGLTLEAEDAYQEAQIILATRHRQARAALAQGNGVLHRWLHQRLRDRFLTEAKRRTSHASYEALTGGVA
ncbi:hypothetical protein ACFU6R_03370 [Streptomyces sp. NPDC057499]|uniref:hypothetical protein n=1 Tax=Streptomyces sp. NPDC057499 TaxID=3346150 RepID=UPI0036C61877